ncbi:hypothetical protein HQ544_00895 [Candidatus Falkowbacteria bacterium]|nr:hypothetical protein [Candidatus Falkowbacteria bacterium]
MQNLSPEPTNQPKSNPALKVLGVVVMVPLLFLLISAIIYGCSWGMGGIVYGGIFYLSLAFFLIQVIITVFRRRRLSNVDIGFLVVGAIVVFFYYVSTYPNCIWG